MTTRAVTAPRRRRSARWTGPLLAVAVVAVVAAAVAWAAPTPAGADEGCGPLPDSIAVTASLNIAGTEVEETFWTNTISRTVTAQVSANLVREHGGTYRASTQGSTSQSTGSFLHETDQQYHKIIEHSTYVARSSTLASPPNLSLTIDDVDGPCEFALRYAPGFVDVQWESVRTTETKTDRQSGTTNDAWGAATLKGPLTDFTGRAEISGSAEAGSSSLTTPDGELSGVPPPYAGSATAVIGAADPILETRLDVDHLDVPSITEWTEVPTDGTYDGNIVRLTATVENPGGPASGRIEIVDRTSGEVIVAESGVALDAGTNEFLVSWDTLDRAWADDGTRAGDPVLVLTVEVDGVVGTDSRTVPVLPKPLVLAHGWNSDANAWTEYPSFVRSVAPDWKSFAIGDGTYPGVMDTGSITKPWYAGKTPYQNAREMDTYVAALRDDLNAQQVDIVAHSMGGLIGRRYLASTMPAPGGVPAVARLLLLGTPNLGSVCADLLPSLSAIPLRPDVTRIFNSTATATNGTHLAIMAGNPLDFTCVGGGPGDSVVEVTSAFGLPSITDRMTVDTLHTSMTGDRGNFDDFVRPRLTGSAGAADDRDDDADADAAPRFRSRGAGQVTSGAEQPTTGADPRAGETASDLHALAAGLVTVAPGATVDVDVLVDDLDRIGATLVTAPGIAAQLLAPRLGADLVAPVGPADPDQPADPVAPGDPADPGQSARPGAPGDPANPVRPRDPVAPAGAGDPAAAGDPGAAGDPASPTVRNDPAVRTDRVGRRPAAAPTPRSSAPDGGLWSTPPIDDPAAGAWRLRLTSTSRDPVEVTYAVGGVGGVVTLDLDIPDGHQDGEIVATARLARGGAAVGGVVTGQIFDGRSRPKDITFRDDGDGEDEVAGDGTFTATFEGSPDGQRIIAVAATDADRTTERASLAVYGSPATEPDPAPRDDGDLPAFEPIGQSSSGGEQAAAPADSSTSPALPLIAIFVAVVLVLAAGTLGSSLLIRRRRQRP